MENNLVLVKNNKFTFKNTKYNVDMFGNFYNNGIKMGKLKIGPRNLWLIKFNTN
jgi:hypothetical protein